MKSYAVTFHIHGFADVTIPNAENEDDAIEIARKKILSLSHIQHGMVTIGDLDLLGTELDADVEEIEEDE